LQFAAHPLKLGSVFSQAAPALEDAVDSQQQECHLMDELTLMTQQVMTDHLRYEKQADQTRSRMALAQFFLCYEIMKSLRGRDDWSTVLDSIYDYADSETDLYRAARQAGDRDQAALRLARVRCARTLIRRVENPTRQTLLAIGPRARICLPLDETVEESGRQQELWWLETAEYQEGEPPREIVPQHKRLARELTLLSRETAAAAARLAGDEAAARSFHAARAQSCRYLVRRLENPEERSGFEAFLIEHREELELYYRQARAQEDRLLAWWLLGQLRVVRTLARRLSDVMRRRGLLARIKPALAFH
jgi:hypothetical protein